MTKLLASLNPSVGYVVSSFTYTQLTLCHWYEVRNSVKLFLPSQLLGQPYLLADIKNGYPNLSVVFSLLRPWRYVWIFVRGVVKGIFSFYICFELGWREKSKHYGTQNWGKNSLRKQNSFWYVAKVSFWVWTESQNGLRPFKEILCEPSRPSSKGKKYYAPI